MRHQLRLARAVAGQPVVSNVMRGYNACCFAYGQTGAGKTHTMQGELAAADDGGPNPMRGFAPRTLEAVFDAIAAQEGAAATGDLQREGEQTATSPCFTCRCSFLQIYNERISDLLQPGGQSLALRYSVERGAHVEGLTEQVVVNGARHGRARARAGSCSCPHESARACAVHRHAMSSCTRCLACKRW